MVPCLSGMPGQLESVRRNPSSRLSGVLMEHIFKYAMLYVYEVKSLVQYI